MPDGSPIDQASAQIHDQPPTRTYTVAEVKQIVYPLIEALRGGIVKVWIVRGDGWDDDGVYAVCATRELAEKKRAAMLEADRLTLLAIDEWIVLEDVTG